MSAEPPDVAVIMAALHSAWAEMRELALRLDGVVDRGEMNPWECGLAALLDELWAGHERALFEVGIMDREEMRAAQVEELLTRYPSGESDYYADQLLQADATIADYLRMQAAERLGLLETLVGATPEQLDSQTARQRATYVETLNLLRGERNEHLSRLPLTERHEWERRLGLCGE
jgi:hypothetical protein